MLTEGKGDRTDTRPDSGAGAKVRQDLVRWSTSTPLIAVGAVAFVGWPLDRFGQYEGIGIGDGALNGFYWPVAFVALSIGLWLWQQRNGLGAGPKAGFGSWLLAGAATALLVAAFLVAGGVSYASLAVLLLVAGLRQRDRLVAWSGGGLLLTTIIEYAVLRPWLVASVPVPEFIGEADLGTVTALSSAGELYVILSLVEAVLILGLGLATRVMARRAASEAGLGGGPSTIPAAGQVSAAELLDTVGLLRGRVRADRRATSTPLLVLGAITAVGAVLGLLLMPSNTQAVASGPLPLSVLIQGIYWSVALLVAVVGLWWWQRRQLALLGIGPGVGFGLPVVLVALYQLSWLQELAPSAFFAFDALKVSYIVNPLMVVGATLLVAGARQRNRALCWWGSAVGVLGAAWAVLWIVGSSTATNNEQFSAIGDILWRAERLAELAVGVALLVAGGVARWRRS